MEARFDQARSDAGVERIQASQKAYPCCLVFGSINKKTSGSADVEFRIRLAGKVFRTLFEADVSTAGSDFFVFEPKPHLIIPKNSDVILQATGSTMSIDISAGFNSTLAIVV